MGIPTLIPARPAIIVLVAWFAFASAWAPAFTQQQRRPGRSDSSTEAVLLKANTLTRSGKFHEAIPLFLSIREQVREANAFALNFNLALCYVATGQYQPAIALLKDLRSTAGGNANVENLLAQSLLGDGQPDEAFAAFERAARLTPKDEKLYIYFVESCMDNGHYEEGLKAAEAGLKRLPNSARLMFEHAMLQVNLQFVDEAKQELQKVAKLAPGSDVGYIATAQKSMLEGNVSEAMRVAREGIGNGKEHTMLLALFGEAALQSGVEPGSDEFADARSALERVVAQRPSYISAQITLGKLYLQEGRLDDAIERLNAGRELAPRNPTVYSNLAAAYRRRGDTARAEEALATLAKLNKEEEERIRTAPGDRKAGYMANPTKPKRPPRS